MEDGSLPSYLFIVLIVLIMVFNGLVVACKRALDYIDRNVIKDRLEDEPENKTGVICCGIGYNYVKEAVGDTMNVLKVSQYPLPEKDIVALAAVSENLLVVEAGKPGKNILICVIIQFKRKRLNMLLCILGFCNLSF